MSKFRKKNINYNEDGFSIIHGYGIYDCESPYKWREEKNGKKVVVHCPYFVKWKSVVVKTNCHKYKTRNPSYFSATMSEEWKLFSNFKAWVDSQPNKDWKNCELDKDLLFLGNTHYSPETCVFLSTKLNGFLKHVKKNRGGCMIGVSYKKGCALKPYQADCSDPFLNKKVYIGNFKTEIEAHLAWKSYKNDLANRFSSMETDARIVNSLRVRYSENTDWTKQ